jgi:hypothetical protein
MNMKRTFPAIIIVVLINIPLFSQSVDDFISKYSSVNGPGYMQPLADAFGATFNSGLFHTAHIKKMGFQLYLGVVTSTAFIPDKRKTFTATTEGNFTPVKTAVVPTLLGSNKPVNVAGDNGTTYVFPGGLNVSMLPFAVPQLTVGSVYGTNVTLRYFGYNINKDVGKLSLFSWGLSHSISQYVKILPLDLAVSFYKQQFSLGDYAKCNSWYLGAQASKRIIIFTFYGGLGYEKTKMDIQYTSQTDNTKIAFNLTGSNSIRFTAGVTFNLGPVKLNVDYNLASQSVLSAGLGIGIGDKK